MTTSTTLEGLVWHSLVYQPDGDLGDFAGPDQNNRCESPRHRFGEFKPPAEWVELLWYPTTSKIVARCWKTCEACHVAMAQVGERSVAPVRIDQGHAGESH